MRFRGREAASIENEHVRVTVLREGGHIAEILHQATGVNPLWTPPWPSIEPSAFDPATTDYGTGVEARLLAGIAGHNLCLDIFGGPSEEEAAAGIGVHGEGSVAPYEIECGAARIEMRGVFALAQIRFERTIELHGNDVEIAESVENLAAFDRPIGWTQHVTLGPPFLERGVTRFEVSATQSQVFEGAFGADDYLVSGAEFQWPSAPRSVGGIADLRICNDAAKSSAFTTHLMDPRSEFASFTASHPGLRVQLSYRWKRADFPWLGIWEENHSRMQPPWNGRTLARGMEFGVSPIPETRRRMVGRGSLFGEAAYRWLPARGTLRARYTARVGEL